MTIENQPNGNSEPISQSTPLFPIRRDAAQAFIEMLTPDFSPEDFLNQHLSPLVLQYANTVVLVLNRESRRKGDPGLKVDEDWFSLGVAVVEEIVKKQGNGVLPNINDDIALTTLVDLDVKKYIRDDLRDGVVVLAREEEELHTGLEAVLNYLGSSEEDAEGQDFLWGALVAYRFLKTAANIEVVKRLWTDTSEESTS